MKMNMKLPFSFVFNKDLKLLIQHKVWIGCFYVICLIPSFFVFFHIFHANAEHKDLKQRIEHLQIRMERIKTVEKDRNTFISEYSEADPYYIDNTLESLVFLKPEADALKLVYNHPAFQSSDYVKSRMETLINGGNHLIFSEKKRKSENGIEEIEYAQARPVEMNVIDLKTTLAAVEGVRFDHYTPPLGRPQFIIQGFHLTKKKLAERETYFLEMQLIKRGVAK